MAVMSESVVSNSKTFHTVHPLLLVHHHHHDLTLLYSAVCFLQYRPLQFSYFTLYLEETSPHRYDMNTIY